MSTSKRIQMHTTLYKTDKQQGSTIQHRELYSISYNYLQYKVIEKEYIYISECILIYDIYMKHFISEINTIFNI